MDKLRQVGAATIFYLPSLRFASLTPFPLYFPCLISPHPPLLFRPLEISLLLPLPWINCIRSAGVIFIVVGQAPSFSLPSSSSLNPFPHFPLLSCPFEVGPLFPLPFLSHFLLPLFSRPSLSNHIKIKSNYFIVRLKVDERAGQLSLPHLGITKTEK